MRLSTCSTTMIFGTSIDVGSWGGGAGGWAKSMRSRLMTFSEMGIFSRITSRDENSHETS